MLTSVVDTEAKRLGYYHNVIHSDRGTEFVNINLGKYCQKNIIRQRYSNAYTPQQNGLAEQFNRNILESLRTILYDSGLRRTLWNEVLSGCMLTLNQILTHRSNKSPYELFKGQAIPIDFFHPIGNPVVVYSHQKKTKLDPRGVLGRLIAFDAEMKSYRILLDDRQILDTKNIEFLDFDCSLTPQTEHDELFLEEKVEKSDTREIADPFNEEMHIKEEESEEKPLEEETTCDFATADEDSEEDETDVAGATVGGQCLSNQIDDGLDGESSHSGF